MIGFLQITIGGLLQGSVFALLALGMSLIYRVTGVVNLSQGAFCVFGALLMYTLQVVLGWPVPLAVLGAAVGSVGFGVLLGVLTFVPGVAKLPISSMLVMTAGLLTLIEGVLLIGWSSEPYALPPFSGEVPVDIWGLRIPTQGFWLAGITALIIVVMRWLLLRTTVGLALRGCAENRLAARLMGINVKRMTLFAFALAALIAALGGIAAAPITSVEFDTGHFFTNFGFIAVAIGGISSFLGSIVGGLFIGVTEQLAAGYVSSLFANGLALAMLLAMLVWRPAGLFASGPARRTDVRDEQRIHRSIIRLDGRGGALFYAVALAALVALPFLLPPGGLLNSLVITAILYIAVLGLDVLMGFTGQVSLGQSGFMAVGGYTAAILVTNHGWEPLAGIAAAIVLSMLCALGLSLITSRLRGHYLALATLAFGLVVDSLTTGLGGLTGGPSGLVGIPSFSIGDWSADDPVTMYFIVLGLIVVLLAMLSAGMRSGFGRSMKMVRADQQAAAALGVNVPRVKLVALLISAALAAVSGALYAFYFHYLSPDMVGTQRSFEMLAMLVAGGEGTLIGPLLGVALMTLLPTLFQPLAAYKTFAEGALLVAAFLYLPEGIFGGLALGLQRLLRLGRRRPAGGGGGSAAQMRA